MPSPLLLAAVVALASGPLVARAAASRPRLLAIIDAVVVVIIGGLVLIDIVPHIVTHRDGLAALFMVAGFALPTVAERLFNYGVERTHLAVLILAMLGLAIHSMLDGSAIAQSASSGSAVLGYGVLLHQVPVSLMIWWVLSDRSPAIRWAVLGFMAVCTLAGYVVEPALFDVLPERARLWFEALVGGSLLHVVAHAAQSRGHTHDHQHGHDHTHGRVHGH